ncbi:hypothetical protein RJT34_22500 [Clitoria ternatea]|uniref:Exocyst component Exo84 C-terminal domain-containing protein n=1 Tax=Clitoria ternatea TaxID=43366 RepID=A0AAN9FJ84_CLITE
MEMESSTPLPKFHFRDHTIPESRNSSEPNSEVLSNVSRLSVTEADAELESMTARGIKHLCEELRELKEAANEDLHKNIFAKYSSFLRILEKVTGVENELVQLENHLVSHKRLVKSLTDQIYPKILSIDLAFEDHVNVVPSPHSELEVHINDVSEKLDIFISEKRLDEALHLLESVDEHYQSIQLRDFPHNKITLYSSMIFEKKSMLMQQMIQIVENKRAKKVDLQRALDGVCRLGDSQLAMHLLLKHYHFHIVSGIDYLQWGKSLSNEKYIKDLARFVFSTISQAAKSFVMLCGESSPYASELIIWAYEEIKTFVICFDKYVQCTSEISGRLSSSIKAAKFALSYCSLLENQKLVLRPHLVKHLCPCMEKILNTHINHLKKVIAIFSANDPWVLEKYLVPRVFVGVGSSILAIEEQNDYCLLTTSGRKVLTLLQAIIDDIYPLIALQMGSLIISVVKDIFMEYIFIVEKAFTHETRETKKGSPRIKFAKSLPQEVSILANIATLVHFLSTMIKSIFNKAGEIDIRVSESNLLVEQQELDDFLLSTEEGSNKLRNMFCLQLIQRVSSTYGISHEIFSTSRYNDQFDATIPNPMPSAILQAFFLELRKIEQLKEENVFKANWLMGLLRELMESMFTWISKNKEILVTTKENMSSQTDVANQFILHVQFLVEIGMYGGYFSNDPLLLLTLMKSTFNSVGLDPFKDVDDDDWAVDAATKAIQWLLEIEKTSLHLNEPVFVIREESHENENQIHRSACGSDKIKEDDINSLENNSYSSYVEKYEIATHEPKVPTDAEMTTIDTEIIYGGESLDKKEYVDTDNSNFGPSSSMNFKSENATFEEAGVSKK